MEVIILKNPEEVAALATNYVAKLVQNKPSAILGLATGSTPIAMYKNLISLYQEKELDFSKVKTFNLDEYVGLEKNHPGSYYTYMKNNFFDHVNIPESNCNIPDGMSKDLIQESLSYEERIKGQGGIDLQVLGIGRDGHIGFNEPSSSLSSRTRLKTLTMVTRKDNAQYFNNLEEVPFHVLTMGVGTIMEAKHILLMATGESKAVAIQQCVEGPITAMCPASILQFHPKVSLLIDKAAASKLERTDYYQWVYEKKPDWQKKNLV